MRANRSEVFFVLVWLAVFLFKVQFGHSRVSTPRAEPDAKKAVKTEEGKRELARSSKLPETHASEKDNYSKHQVLINYHMLS